MEVHYGIDASAAQGRVDWTAVDKSTAFGIEKVSQDDNYFNQYWPDAKAQMLARKAATGFVPAAYLFMQAGRGSAQAQYFAERAGDLSEFGIGVDVEPWPRVGSYPTLADALACVRELRTLFPGHPIGGYLPPWYWGEQPTTFVDWRWTSRYVAGVGTPSSLYQHVPESFWAPYGGGSVDVLQFTSSAVVPGATGLVDCSAFRGTLDSFRSLVLPHTVTPPPAPQPAEKWQIHMMHKLPTIKQGSSLHSDVRRAQALLVAAGAHMTGEPGISALDGTFGPVTKAAVEQVQHAHGLPADGIIGPHTWSVLVTGADL